MVSSTPSPHTAALVRPKGRSNSESSTGSKSRSPYVSPMLLSKGKSSSKGRSDKSQSGKSDKDDCRIEVENIDSLSADHSGMLTNVPATVALTLGL